MDSLLKIVNFLGKRLDEPFTLLEISRETGVPYATLHRTVGENADLFVAKRVGKARTLALNRRKPTIRSYLAISSEEEKKAFLKRQPIIAIIASDLDTTEIVLLFGSYAKGTQRERSDIDIIVINKEGKRTLSFSKYELLYDKQINPLFFTKTEFKAMLRDEEENVGKQALQGHIVLNNPEAFWECVLHG